MPANLTPEYQRAEQRYRQASSWQEKLEALEEMLRVMPKHKGTDKLQADVKRRISQLRKAGPPKGAAHRDLFHVPRQGAGQVTLLGPPNSGKSSLVAALTRAPVKVADFPFSTHAPVPGMAHFEDVPIQVVDLPPVTAEHVPAGMYGALRNADAIMIVLDAASPSLLEDMELSLDVLARRDLVAASPADGQPARDPEGRQIKKTLVVATKADVPGAAENFAALQELYADRLQPLLVSTRTGQGLDQIPRVLFDLLSVIRIYAKPPGKPADMQAPFLLPRGSTLTDLVEQIHRGLVGQLRTARVWGDGVFDGQQVPHDHVLRDKDVVELHIQT